MFIYFASLLQIFVPYLPSSKLEFPELDKAEFDSLLSTNKSIIAFCVEKSYKEMDPVIKSMNKVASLFSDPKYNVTFVYLGKGIAQEVSYANYLSLPSFFFFKNKKLKYSFAYPKTDGAFIKIVQSLLIKIEFFENNTFDRNSLILRSKKEVLDYLGDCYFTILSLPKLYKKALKIIHLNPRIECDIVLVDKNVLNEFDLDDDRLALFRKEDEMIVSFSNFSTARVPYYSVINYYDVHDEIRPIFGISTSSLKFERKYQNFLYELSDKYPDFFFCFIGKDYYAYVNTTVGVDINNLLHKSENDAECVLVLFNSYKRYTYNISDVFSDQFFSKPFDQSKWIEASKVVLNSIRKKERAKHFISEPEPENQPNSIQKVVGTTFDDFVNQDKDIIMLFGVMDSYSTATLNNTYYRFYNITKDALNESDKNYINEKLDFGLIDLSRNSGNFPYFPDFPLIFIYPAKNKSNPVQFRGFPAYENFLWFLKRYGSFEIPIESPEGPPISHKQFEQDFVHLLGTTFRMPEEEKEKFFEWAAEIANLTFTDICHFPQVPHKYCQNHHHDDHDDDDHHEYNDL